MRSSGNSNVAVCIDNILKTFKSEVPYARNKGINHSTLDLPSSQIEQQLNEDAEEAVSQYEARVDIDDIVIESYSNSGTYKYRIEVSTTS